MNNKYSKPIVKDLTEMPITSGSCFSGLDERTVLGSCTPGASASPSCTTGDFVLPRIPCSTGSAAAYSCYTGLSAG